MFQMFLFRPAFIQQHNQSDELLYKLLITTKELWCREHFNNSVSAITEGTCHVCFLIFKCTKDPV